MAPVAAGWQADPSNPNQLRYWDGSTWTTHTMAAPPGMASDSEHGGSRHRKATIAALIAVAVVIAVVALEASRGSTKVQLSTAHGPQSSEPTVPSAPSRSAHAADPATASTVPPTTTFPTMPDPPSTTVPPATGPVGQSINVSWSTGATASVTLDQVVDPAQNTYGQSTSGGDRFVACHLTVRNTGSRPITESIYSALIVYDANGQGFSGDFGNEPNGPSFTFGNIEVSPGGSASGWVLLDVTIGDPLARVTFTPALQNDPSDIATWTL